MRRRQPTLGLVAGLISCGNGRCRRGRTDTVSGRLMAEIHYYTPWNFTGMTKEESWGKQFFYWGAGNHSTTDTARNPTWGEEAALDALLGSMKTRFADKGIPVVVGEFGAIDRSRNVVLDAPVLAALVEGAR